LNFFIVCLLGKALGLIDSDSEDELPNRNNKKKPTQSTTIASTTSTNNTNNNNIPDSPTLQEVELSTTDQYLAAAEALMATPVLQAPVHSESKSTRKSSSLPSDNSSSFM
jgi:hypothetical protein